MKSPVLGDDLKKLYPISFEGQSDTATFDNALELLTMGGYPLAHAAMMMIPEAWEQHTTDGRAPPRVLRVPRGDDRALGRPGGDGLHRRQADRRHARPQRPAPGALHRHRRRPGGDGLRVRRAADPREPHRQEVAPAAGQDVPDRPRAGPHRRRRGTEEPVRLGQALPAVDRERAHQARRHRRPMPRRRRFSESLLDRQQAFGYTQEDIKFLLGPMAQAGEEGIGSMGNDSPLAVLSDKNKPLYNYFKQLFAQVTNPPIDPIREAIVMSLNCFIGPKPNLLDINAVNPPMRLEVTQPILDFDDMARLRDIERHTGGKFKSYELDITYPLAWGDEGVEAKLASLCAEAVDALRGGHNILIITDRRMDRDHVAIPALLALSAIHHHLVREGLRTTAGLVVETGFGARGAPLRGARRLRRRGRPPLPGDGDAGRAARGAAGRAVGREGDLQLRQGDRQGPVEDHVQDGRLDLHVLLRRAAVRGDRPGPRRWSRSTSAARPPRSAASACSRSPRRRSACTAPPSATTRCSPTCSTPAANTPGACAAKSTCGRPTPSPSCSTARARTASRPTRNTRRSSTTSRAAT